MADRAVPAFGVVVPVKPLHLAKSRLHEYGGPGRADLALAFARDVVATARACPSVGVVLVVTDDPAVAAAVADDPAQAPRRSGEDRTAPPYAQVRVVPDLPAAGLDAALAHGARVLRRARPALAVAALSADLPAARADDLTQALTAVRRRGLVADAAGTGTTLLAVAPGLDLEPAYGPGSARRHRAAGAVDLPAGPGLRRDVDTPADLAEALRLGVGRHTRLAAARLRQAG